MINYNIFNRINKQIEPVKINGVSFAARNNMADKILLADDEEDIRYVMEIVLKVAGYEVMMRSDTGFAEDLDHAVLPDLYLLDRHMNGADLLQTCKQLKAHPKTQHIPVIMVSADPTLKNLYKEAGADDFIAKPFEKYQLLDSVARQLKKKTLPQALSA